MNQIEEIPIEINESKFEKIKENLLNHYDRFILPRLGIVFALLSQFFGSIMVLSSKLLEVNADFPKPLNPLETILVRMIMTGIVTLIYSKYTNSKDFPFGPKNLRWLLILRAFTGFTGIYCLYFALQYISMSTNQIIGFLTPVLTLILAYFILGEKYTIYEGIGGIFSIIGVLLVVQPTFLFPNAAESDNSGVESADPKLRALGVTVSLVGCMSGAGSSIILRLIGKRCDPVISVQCFSFGSGILAIIGFLVLPGAEFQMLTNFKQWFLFFMLGVSGFLTQFCWTCGIAREKAGRLVLLTYFGMIYTIFWEIVIWSHLPSLLTWCGFLIIVLSTCTIIYLKPVEVEFELVPDRLSGDLVDDEERLKFELEMRDFIIDDDDDDVETSASSLNSVRSKLTR